MESETNKTTLGELLRITEELQVDDQGRIILPELDPNAPVTQVPRDLID